MGHAGGHAGASCPAVQRTTYSTYLGWQHISYGTPSAGHVEERGAMARLGGHQSLACVTDIRMDMWVGMWVGMCADTRIQPGLGTGTAGLFI